MLLTFSKNKMRAIHLTFSQQRIKSTVIQGRIWTHDGFLHGSNLCDVFWGAGWEVGRGEGESTVCPRIIRLEVDAHFLFPLVTLTKIQAVHTHKPVRAGDHLHHQGQLLVKEKCFSDLRFYWQTRTFDLKFTKCKPSWNKTVC